MGKTTINAFIEPQYTVYTYASSTPGKFTRASIFNSEAQAYAPASGEQCEGARAMKSKASTSR
jgi:hypothetical protein